MSKQWTASDYVARAMSTRPVQIAGTDYVTVVTREALDGMAAQVAEGFIPIVVEHLSYIPPIGRWHTGEVIEAPDGGSAPNREVVGFASNHQFATSPEADTM